MPPLISLQKQITHLMILKSVRRQARESGSPPLLLLISTTELRSRIECCNSPRSKASREKLRRDRLNERFLELSSVLDPGRPPKTEKVAILSDAQKMLIELRAETQKLKESNEELQEKIKELKAEKNELRDEKQSLKEEKENLEQQVKNLSSKPGFLSHPSAMGAAFTAQGQVAGNKLMPFIGYPSVAMWQFMQPAVVDTSQDHVLRPPVA
ncbi:transcription factor ILR3 isoform X3 [Nicotiana tabacum]|uniref:Transcription factor ILR3 isoform X3 n=1 Tax=Nicotiana tabacum TaxID=4097 RepID=A0AC58T8W2_TOBAC